MRWWPVSRIAQLDAMAITGAAFIHLFSLMFISYTLSEFQAQLKIKMHHS